MPFLAATINICLLIYQSQLSAIQCQPTATDHLEPCLTVSPCFCFLSKRSRVEAIAPSRTPRRRSWNDCVKRDSDQRARNFILWLGDGWLSMLIMACRWCWTCWELVIINVGWWGAGRLMVNEVPMFRLNVDYAAMFSIDSQFCSCEPNVMYIYLYNTHNVDRVIITPPFFQIYV